MAVVITHPEITRLQRLCVEHRAAIRSCVYEWNRLATEVRPRLLALYNHEFGTLEQDKQRLALESAELFRRIELLSIKVQRGEPLTAASIELVNKVVDTEYARLRAKLRNMTSERDETIAPSTEATQGELVKMYRVLAKQLHPDAGGDSTTVDDWHQVQKAYASKDSGRLHALLAALGVDPEKDDEGAGWTLERWQTEELQLGAKRRVEERKLQRLTSEELFSIALDLDNPEWVAHKRSELETELKKKQAEFTEQQEVYRDLTQGLVDPSSVRTTSQEEKDFAEEFMKNTYFDFR